MVGSIPHPNFISIPLMFFWGNIFVSLSPQILVAMSGVFPCGGWRVCTRSPAHGCHMPPAQISDILTLKHDLKGLILIFIPTCLSSSILRSLPSDDIVNMPFSWVREYPFTFMYSAFGHCPNSDWTPPPRTQPGTLGSGRARHSGTNLRKNAKSLLWQ